MTPEQQRAYDRAYAREIARFDREMDPLKQQPLSSEEESD